MRRERQQASSGKSSSAGKGSGSSGPKPPPSRFRLWVRRLFRWGLGLALVGAIAVAVAVGIAVQRIPSFEELKRSPAGQTIRVHAADGTVFLSLGPNYGRWLTLDETPQVMQDAMVAVEDRRFRYHPGIDPVGMSRAAVFAVQHYGTGRRMQGASTITQQLARNIFLSNSYTWTRKLREMVLAMALEWKFSKDEILELYLNKVYFGGGAYGVDSAARKFFGHPGTQLSLPEAAIIAGLVKAPSHYSPTADAQAAVGRASVVLGLMRENGVISADQAASVDFKAIKFASESGQNSVRYFTDWALPQLDILLGENTDPIEVWTTLDIGMQRAATEAIQKNAPAGAQGALVSMDRDGAVLAMVGGTDYVTSNYNRAVNAVRQPGSAWKLFVYLAALEAGYTPSSEVVDEPVTIDGWSPRNSGGTYAGKIDVRTAFAYSKNTVAAQLGNEVGFSAVAGMARRFGISTPISTVPSMVLGSNEVRLIDMTRAFTAVAAKGQAVDPYGITKIATTDGRVLYQRSGKGGQMLVPAYVAAGITDLLQSAVAIGTGRAAQIGAADAQIASAAAALRGQRQRQREIAPLAPAAGVVEQTFYNPGEWVPANAPVVAVLPDAKRKLRFFVPQDRIAALHPGSAVRFTCDGCGAARSVKVTWISPRSEFTPPVIYSEHARAKLVFMVEALLPADAKPLPPGLPVQVMPE